ncbi:hypothetical protein J4E93_000759 [Alternaria ventricosa]|uniref:uncharacterized protein n=1 Tax=Alternaria ventricosa TaxID=1187951 RepID=UPI0020C37D60|nr:uncharacterized protein J4E93_000759 [Alternaria ventricosa]KAI4656043.1 hypothetical protein J4E93_000759 [Alternaria ventricosa]
MDNTSSPLLEQGQSARVLGVVEMLENILLNLSPADTLKNAQGVSKFWQGVVQGSNALKKKCFLVADEKSEKETDRLLFLGAHLPDLSNPLLARWSQFGDLEELCQLTKVTPGTLRALFADDPTADEPDAIRRLQYKVGIQDYFEKLNDDKEIIPLTINVGRQCRGFWPDDEYDPRTYESLLDMSRLNPLLRRSWTGKASAIFTGYEKHMIFLLGDNFNEGCEYFTYIREFLETFANAMSTDASRRPWRTVQISSPAVTKLTIMTSLPGWFGAGTHDYLGDTGITMLDFAHVFIWTIRKALEDYSPTDLEYWMGQMRSFKRGGRTWRSYMRSYKKERDLIEKLMDRIDDMKGIW